MRPGCPENIKAQAKASSYHFMIYYTEPKIYTLILNYCSYEDTLNCVNTVSENNFPSNEIVIIDNNSPDKSGERLHEKFPEYKYLQTGKNLGYAGGNNYGITYAIKKNADFIFIVNPDVRIQKGTISGLLNILLEDDKRAAVSALEMDPQNKIDELTATHLLSPEQVICDNVEDLEKKKWISLDSLFGACVLISCKILNTVGLFDPIYFCYYEEKDLFRRCKYFGYEVGISTRTKVIHKRTYEVLPSKDPYYTLREYLLCRNAFIYDLKNPNVSLKVAAYRCLRALVGAFLQSVKGLHFKKTVQLIWILIWLFFNMPKILKRRKMDMRG